MYTNKDLVNLVFKVNGFASLKLISRKSGVEVFVFLEHKLRLLLKILDPPLETSPVD